MSASSPQRPIELHAFDTYFGLPFSSCAPFPAKLETWLRITELPYRSVVANDARQGPKGKSPWIVDGDLRMGDSELIIGYLRRTYGVDPDAHLAERARAEGVAVQRLLEEHFHQIWEYLAFVAPDGWAETGPFFVHALGPIQGRIVGPIVRRSLKAQLHARGIGRHSHEEILKMGMDDLDALAALLGDRPYFGGDRPATVDASAFGFLGLTVYWPEVSPLHRAARANDTLVAYCDRMRSRYFGAEGAGGVKGAANAA